MKLCALIITELKNLAAASRGAMNVTVSGVGAPIAGPVPGDAFVSPVYPPPPGSPAPGNARGQPIMSPTTAGSPRYSSGAAPQNYPPFSPR